MKKYFIYLSVLDKKYRLKVPANSEFEALQKAKQKVIDSISIEKANEDSLIGEIPSRNFNNPKDISDWIMGNL